VLRLIGIPFQVAGNYERRRQGLAHPWNHSFGEDL
jgi:hypothetical protein